MRKKAINERCPLHDECGKKKCEHVFKEDECPYYMGNARPGFELNPSDPVKMSFEDELAEAEEAYGSTWDDDEKRLSYISVDEIYPHPDNPRKDLGDLAELVDSIKANGIFQNLTVVPGHFQTKSEWKKLSAMYTENPTEEIRHKMNSKRREDGFTVIIGHRRLEAAKRAGLAVVPCIITEMSEQEQLATMLLENMQRSDLTPYEEAQGFQLMMDFGSTVSEIAEKTGFSQKTIRHRIKMLELDKQAFKASEERGATISDYIKLEQIKDINERNKVLAHIGTSDFDWMFKAAISKEKKAECLKAWTDFFESIGAAERIENKDISGKVFLRTFFTEAEITEEQRTYIGEQISECLDTSSHLYWVPGSSRIYLYKDKSEEEATEANKNAEKEARRIEKVERLREIAKTAHELRKEFVKSYTGKKENLNVLIFEFYAHQVDLDSYNLEEEEYADILNIKIEEDEDGDPICVYDAGEFKELVFKNPQKVLLTSIYIHCEDDGHIPNFHDYYGNYHENEMLKSWYDTLEKIGYQMSTDEKQMLDGTHPAYKDGEQE